MASQAPLLTQEGSFKRATVKLVHTFYERPLQLLDPSFSAPCQEGNRRANHGK